MHNATTNISESLKYNLPFQSESEESTLAWGRALAETLKPGDSLALQGNLGAGKTVLTRGICLGLGFQGAVHSPSYALVHEYPHDLPIYHMDLYRLPEGADFEEIGVEHYSLSEGIALIEWPERLESLDVGITHHIKIEHLDEEKRLIVVSRPK